MAEVKCWIKGEIDPPQKGEYYVILEATQDIADFKKGDIEIMTDYYNKETGFETVGRNNPTWRVVAWADILRPDIPKDLIGKVKRYFGIEVER